MKKTLSILSLLAMLIFTVSAQNADIAVGNGSHYEVTINTSRGAIVVKLYNETPLHRDNFVKLAKSDFYIGVLFHRVIKDFMIQAGDPNSRESSEVRTYGDGDPGYTIPAEILPQFFHKKGALAAARTGDEINPERRSSGSQFYIVTGKVLTDSTMKATKENATLRGSWEMTPEREQVYRTVGGTPFLDGSYTVFGEVLRGQNIVDAINKVPTYRNDRPQKDIYIKGVTVKIVKDRK